MIIHGQKGGSGSSGGGSINIFYTQNKTELIYNCNASGGASIGWASPRRCWRKW